MSSFAVTASRRTRVPAEWRGVALRDYVLVVNGRRFELGETDLGMIADRLPGTALASEVMADRPDGANVVIDVDELGIDREALHRAIAEVRRERATAVWAETLAAIEAELQSTA